MSKLHIQVARCCRTCRYINPKWRSGEDRRCNVYRMLVSPAWRCDMYQDARGVPSMEVDTEELREALRDGEA